MISIHALARSATDKRNMHSRKNNNFNPRTREECDLPAPAVFLIASKFQSTHSRGVRQATLSIDSMNAVISIHALARSATI